MKSLKGIFGLLLLSLLFGFGTTPVYAGDLCQGDIVCNISFLTIGYTPYFLIISTIIAFITKVFLRSFPTTKIVTVSILSSLVILFVYHNFLSIWLEKRSINSSYKNYLNQQDYSIFEPSYIPPGHKLFETRVDKGYLSFYYIGNETGQFIVSEFKKPEKIDLTPPDCLIGGFMGQDDDFEVVDIAGYASSVSGKCQELKTPKGNFVYLMTYNLNKEKNLAAVILNNTLITIGGYNFSNEELVKLVDGLEEKSVSNINVRIIDRTIGK